MDARPFDLARIGTGLPVAAAHAELRAALQEGVALVTAPPGTGKTTYVPPLVANLVAAAGAGRTMLTQPRRVAARAAAQRIADLSGTAVGERVGFTVRGEQRSSASTMLEVVTPGVLLRRLLSDPALDGVGAVIIDEVHERSVDIDLLLGMVTEVRELRPELHVVAMSATLQAESITRVLGGATGSAAVALVEVPAALFPLTVHHAAGPAPRLDERGVTRAFLQYLAELAATAQRETGVDALVFVPGAREVDAVVTELRRLADTTGAEPFEALPLHGQVSAREQDRAVSGRGPSDRLPRIVVSTALAESSLTIPGVRLVIDSGLAREVRRDRGRAMSGLVTVSASRASADQRAGRAARQGPGTVIRAYTEADGARMLPQSPPEIASADLTDTALLLAAWGAQGDSGFPWVTQPQPEHLSEAIAELEALKLLDTRGRLTQLGETVVGLPLGARDGRALLSGMTYAENELGLAPRAATQLVAEVMAALGGGFRESGADATALVRALRGNRAPGSERWRRDRKRLSTLLESVTSRSRAQSAADEVGESTLQAATQSGELVAACIALARPEWLARRVAPHERQYLLASGTRAALPVGSPLQQHEWLAVHEVQLAGGRVADGTGAVIRLAAPLDSAALAILGAPLIVTQRRATIDRSRVSVRERRTLGAIVLADTPAAARATDTAPAFVSHLRTAGLGVLEWTEHATQLRNRLALLHRHVGAPWPDVSDAALLAQLDDWLGPDLSELSPTASLRQVQLATALRRLLPWPEAARLDELVPERLHVPSGSHPAIVYPSADTEDGRPVVSVKLQEVFGLAATPRLISGAVPVLFHLLSPARRPVAVTDDLTSFWNGPYFDARKELRGRYPKHPWPEDPWNAEPTARVKHPRRDRL